MDNTSRQAWELVVALSRAEAAAVRMARRSYPTLAQFEVGDFRVIGWTEGDGSGHDGYNAYDYFNRETGAYLGADVYGIEPIFEEVR
jgi:hypothetical protein